MRKKWKYLRDQFAIELSKTKRSRSGDGADETEDSKWPHFKLLLFLKDIVKAQCSTGNLNVINDPVQSGFSENQESTIHVSQPLQEETDSVLDDNEIIVQVNTDVLECYEMYSNNNVVKESESMSLPTAQNSTFSTAKKRAKLPLKDLV